MTKIILYLDAVWVYCIFEPVLHFLQHITKRDNFWWAQVFISCANGSFMIWALYLMSQTQYVGVGVMLLLVSMTVTLGTSQRAWKFLMQKIHKPYRRHKLQRERERGMYFVLRGKENPAMLNLRHARMKSWLNINLLLFFLLTVGDVSKSLELALLVIFLYSLVIGVWLYIRSCSPYVSHIKGTTKKQNTTMLSLLFL
jgi:hypothetical protein